MMVAIGVAPQFSLELLRTCDSQRHFKGYNAEILRGAGRMNRIIAAFVGVLTLGLESANAADILARPVYQAPPIRTSVWTWTGCYRWTRWRRMGPQVME